MISTNYITHQKNHLTGVWIPEKCIKTKIFLESHLIAKMELNYYALNLFHFVLMFTNFVRDILIGSITEWSLGPHWWYYVKCSICTCGPFQKTATTLFLAPQLLEFLLLIKRWGLCPPWNWSDFIIALMNKSSGMMLVFNDFLRLSRQSHKRRYACFSFSCWKCLLWEPSHHVVRMSGHMMRPLVGVPVHNPS